MMSTWQLKPCCFPATFGNLNHSTNVCPHIVFKIASDWRTSYPNNRPSPTGWVGRCWCVKNMPCSTLFTITSNIIAKVYVTRSCVHLPTRFTVNCAIIVNYTATLGTLHRHTSVYTLKRAEGSTLTYIMHAFARGHAYVALWVPPPLYTTVCCILSNVHLL